jgi:hypothetical protein
MNFTHKVRTGKHQNIGTIFVALKIHIDTQGHSLDLRPHTPIAKQDLFPQMVENIAHRQSLPFFMSFCRAPYQPLVRGF